MELASIGCQLPLTYSLHQINIKLCYDFIICNFHDQKFDLSDDSCDKWTFAWILFILQSKFNTLFWTVVTGECDFSIHHTTSEWALLEIFFDINVICRKYTRKYTRILSLTDITHKTCRINLFLPLWSIFTENKNFLIFQMRLYQAYQMHLVNQIYSLLSTPLDS